MSHWALRARLKLRHLLLLSALDETGSAHAAAEQLNIAQPAASKLLKELEDALGVPLFERLPRGMRPTWYGEVMVRHARQALAGLTLANEELNALKAGRYGQVGVGAITSPALALLPPAVARVKLEQPGLRVGVEIESSPVLLNRLREGKLDIVVGRFFAGEDTSQFRYERLSGEPIAAVARPGHPLLRSQRLTLADIAEAGWIVPSAGSVLRQRFDLMFQEAGLAPPFNVIESAAILFVTRTLEQTDMLCVMAAEVARYYASHGVVGVLPLPLPCHMDDFGLITRTDMLLSPGATLMLKSLRAAGHEIYGAPRLAGG